MLLKIIINKFDANTYFIISSLYSNNRFYNIKFMSIQGITMRMTDSIGHESYVFSGMVNIDCK